MYCLCILLFILFNHLEYVWFVFVFSEKYFDMNKKQCRDALDLYKKFLIRMDRVGEFLKVAENVGIDKGEIPDLTKVCSF